jgi:catechol 2,3-dioxygenase-like lactoylglutathione lyase family enzyme
VDDHRRDGRGGELPLVPIAVRPAGGIAGASGFGQILDADGSVLLCLHEWEVGNARGHASLTSPGNGTAGNGLLLFFRVDDFDATLPRARTLVIRFEEEPHVNPNTGTREFSLRDPDGYYVSVSALAA